MEQQPGEDQTTLIMPTCLHTEIIGHVGEFKSDVWSAQWVPKLLFSKPYLPQTSVVTQIPHDCRLAPIRYNDQNFLFHAR